MGNGRTGQQSALAVKLVVGDNSMREGHALSLPHSMEGTHALGLI